LRRSSRIHFQYLLGTLCPEDDRQVQVTEVFILLHGLKVEKISDPYGHCHRVKFIAPEQKRSASQVFFAVYCCTGVFAKPEAIPVQIAGQLLRIKTKGPLFFYFCEVAY
jgi:hypothetical protein